MLVGHSIGAVLATVYAARHPARAVLNIDQPLLAGPFGDLLRSVEPVLRGPDYLRVWTKLLDGMGTQELSPPLRALLRSTPRQDLLLGYWKEVLETSPEELRRQRTVELATLRERGTGYHHVSRAPLPPATSSGCGPSCRRPGSRSCRGAGTSRTWLARRRWWRSCPAGSERVARRARPLTPRPGPPRGSPLHTHAHNVAVLLVLVDGDGSRAGVGVEGRGMTTVGVVGRDTEIDALDRLIGDVRNRGAAVLVRGEAGIGKSALLRLAREAAAERGLRVLSATGVESEMTLPFAGLHQLVRPLFGRLPALPAPQRRALTAAFGMVDDAAPELFLIGLAALNLLSDSAADQPLVLVVDDAHWLDGPSADVLGFVARRLESEPVVLVAAQRDGFPPVLAGPELVEQRLERLDRRSAEEVLARRAPQLDPVRTRAAAGPGRRQPPRAGGAAPGVRTGRRRAHDADRPAGAGLRGPAARPARRDPGPAARRRAGGRRGPG